MKDYTSYMLVKCLQVHSKPMVHLWTWRIRRYYGAKTGTSTYGTEINQQYNLPDNAQRRLD